MTSQGLSPSDIASVVDALRELRVRSLQSRRRINNPPRLPSRKALGAVVEELAAALFPHRLGADELDDEGIDFFVGYTLDKCFRVLEQQVRRELQFSAEQAGSPVDGIDERAENIVRAFVSRLPDIRVLLDSDIVAAYEGDPAALSVDEVLVCYPGISATLYHRIAHQLHRLGAPLTARVIAEIAHSNTGIDIHPGAQIGPSFFIDHGTGVVIGETAVIGQRVRLYQAVTLGAKRFPADENGVLIKGNARHPIVEDDVVIYAGATILGRITIGAGSTIGGNVWLTRSVPANSHVSQAQTRSEIFDGGAGI
ncbi:serine O-acetyltransferase EpsC [Methylococcus sp. EFPC2]|uniref:serine O-acetyltransferase EpsC n=1 Tax=Methylococcus sp. EFPC2 TaxID=2812648 RepID=UPI001967C075|nr:serine O-acetyltransferase EpsC [Methylococcus sp. EFPC2]QSA98269.1 serine acetyltransferase [Methylococcus sp. EFPC2]